MKAFEAGPWRLQAIALCALLLPSLSHAQNAAPPPAGGRAEQLYEEGKKLAAEGQTMQACPLFEESQRLEPAIGTQFNLADCYEKTGRAASALALFREVAKVAQLSNKQERLRAATERADALEKLVPRLRIVFVAPRPDQRARLDGREAATEGPGLPVDPGEHVVRVEAPGATAHETKVVIAAGGGVTDVTVPELKVPVKEVVREIDAPRPYRPLAIGLVAGGVVGLGLGTAFGLVAVGNKSDAHCEGVDCSAAGADASKLRDAQTAGTVSTVAFIAGGVLAAAGIVLWVAAPRGHTGKSLALDLSSQELRVRGAF